MHMYNLNPERQTLVTSQSNNYKWILEPFHQFMHRCMIAHKSVLVLNWKVYANSTLSCFQQFDGCREFVDAAISSQFFNPLELGVDSVHRQVGRLDALLEDMLVIFLEMSCSQDLYLTSAKSVGMPPKKLKLNEVEAPVAKCTTQLRSTRVHSPTEPTQI